METEFDLYTAWLEVQMELEELERKFFEELKGIKDGDIRRGLYQAEATAGRPVGGIQEMAGGGASEGRARSI